jgi:hypothetical protein
MLPRVLFAVKTIDRKNLLNEFDTKNRALTLTNKGPLQGHDNFSVPD